MAENEIPTDEELNAALETEKTEETPETEPEKTQKETVAEKTETTEEETGEEAEPEAQEEDDHKESSRLGRKVKRIESTIETLMTRLEQMNQKPATQEEEELGEDEYIKASDVPKIMERLSKEQQEKQSKYENDYLYKAVQIGADEDLDTETQDLVFEEMQTKFNSRITGNAAIDAELNFSKALASVYSKKAATPKNPLKGGKPKEALGVGAPSTTTPKEGKKSIKLDSYAAEFAKSTGMSEEDIQSALQSNPTVLRGYNKSAM